MPTSLLQERRLATRFLRGTGMEIGALHRPIDVDPNVCSVIYADRLTIAQLRDHFPEIAAQEIVPPDIICDVAANGLSFLRDDSLDFLMASHLLEHVPNPLGLLRDCHRVLRESGMLLLIVPDKNFTFDRDRERTPLSHVIKDFHCDATAIDEEHLVDFIVHAAKEDLPADPEARRRRYQQHLDRSIHVHAWTSEDVKEMLIYMAREEQTPWELCECYLPKGMADEAIFVLRKIVMDPGPAASHLEFSADALFEREMAVEHLHFNQAGTSRTRSWVAKFRWYRKRPTSPT